MGRLPGTAPPQHTHTLPYFSRGPRPSPTSRPISPAGPGFPMMGPNMGEPEGCTEQENCSVGGKGSCLAGGGAGAGAGSQAGGFVCEKNRGLARVGTLASLNANGTPVLSSSWTGSPSSDPQQQELGTVSTRRAKASSLGLRCPRSFRWNTWQSNSGGTSPPAQREIPGLCLQLDCVCL